MKRILPLLALLIFILVACGNSKGGSFNNTDATSVNNAEAPGSSGNEDDTGNNSHNTNTSDKKVLVAYFSATGTTKDIAQYIAKSQNGDLFELVPVNPYSDEDLNWRNAGSRVSLEHENLSETDIALEKSTPDNWESYDIIYIGYPIWWQDAAWPINHFLSDNDFSGKTVIPFATSQSSDMGDSKNHLEALAGSGNWLEGKRFSVSATENEVNSWIGELDLD